MLKEWKDVFSALGGSSGPDFFELLPTSQVKKLARYCGLGQKRLG